MDRYGKYILHRCLWLSDDCCQYFVQETSWCHEEILDVQFISFMILEEAEQWLRRCVRFDPAAAMRRLRSFLAFNSSYPVYRLDDRRVIHQVARQISLFKHPIVIKPQMGRALFLDDDTGKPKIPTATESEPELDSPMAELKAHLDALVAGQQKKSDELEARPAKTGDTEKAAALGPSVAGLKKMWHLYTPPSRLTWATVQSIRYSGRFTNTGPSGRELTAALNPLVETHQQAKEIAGMIHVLISDDETYELLYDFARRYYDATHPLEKTAYMAEDFPETAMTLILALFNAGNHAGAKMMIGHARRAEKAHETLKEIYEALKRMPARLMLPKKKIAEKPGIPEKNKHEKREAAVPPLPKKEKEPEPLTIEFIFDDGTPITNKTVEVELPSGSIVAVQLDQDGMGQIIDVDARQSKLTPDDVHADEWWEQ